MKKRILISIAVCFIFLGVETLHPIAQWSILTYIQADNNLGPFADYNINDMEKVGSTNDVNILVQWDQPNNLKTWRYRIGKGSRIEDASLSQEMGIEPVKEIVDSMKWVKNKYPAKRYMIILWNHGNGVLDRNKTKNLFPRPWLHIPGFNRTLDDRGILYDDSDHSFVSNQGLSNAFSQVKQVLGQKIHVVGMDACMMAMLEIAYQIKDYAHYLVGSEHTEPGYGWSYSGFLSPLVLYPRAFRGKGLARKIVQTYKAFYNNDSECTQSAIKLSRVNYVKKTLDNVLKALEKSRKKNAKKTKKIVKNARRQSIEFYLPEYIDLYSFYKALIRESLKSRYRSKYKFRVAQFKLRRALYRARRALKRAIAANAVGNDFYGARGMSIYYPTRGIDSTYPNTAYAQKSLWLDFLKKY